MFIFASFPLTGILLAALTAHLKALAPAGCEAVIDSMDGSPAHRVKTDSPFLTSMIAGLEEVFPNKAQLIGTGGSIPLVGSMHDLLGLDSLLVGFAPIPTVGCRACHHSR